MRKDSTSANRTPIFRLARRSATFCTVRFTASVSSDFEPVLSRTKTAPSSASVEKRAVACPAAPHDAVASTRPTRGGARDLDLER